ncbi:MAG: 16S rRNA (adenine(1518)-N(6)/adenine(1519)-N(6))-dimethyltransferase RsmA [Neomegalonema sp.]|nr:16S rRNA (adenine(1518)-N(6)/adenine(1519)-N(6))-dimethyltransferase RsmA [Neomegalonema sp.]
MTADRLAADGLPPLREVIATHSLAARKALGQNFLLDLNLTRRIARSAAPLGHVVEIGPGPGGLTRALLMEGASHVLAIERDARCMPALAQIAEHWPQKLSVIEGDALQIDPKAHFPAQIDAPIQIVANLPYNVGTELLTRWLTSPTWPAWWSKLTLMFQREVAERIVAVPGSKAYGRLGVLAQWRCEAQILFDVSAQAFTPPPKVTSSIVQLRPRAEPLAPAELGVLEKVTAAAFGQRRKMLRQSLKSLTPAPEALLEEIGIAPTQRAETVDIAGFCAIARAIAAQRA